ncbi:MAG: serine/threonine protein kinase [Planctomycetes bacterium]|nr:serine/threonine protein kinase [Planctomycetota bacterium]
MSTGPESPLDDDIRSVQIGPYRILDVLGEGGMGTVYLAEQQEPVTRRVALKVIKLGMDSKAVVARFEQERQTLALMQHDGIAKVYDCGTTETGQPFFVMELVQGTPLTTFCDDARLTLAQRLQLLQQVCSAVQHAHQKGIVHRDLKPGNVLVTEREGKLQAKVIDFGLAKAIGQSPLDATLLTAVGQIVGTPEYMAPEQADPTNLDIDTRADVYSLGVMLYELLVGRVPFPVRDLRNAGLLEMQRILREVEPPRPSTNLRASAGATAFAAETRRMSPSALRRALEQDLDWVVLKALDKDRNRRYETPANLAEDLQRFLDDQPVAAGPPSLGHRVRKFVRRHRTQVMVTTIVGMTAVVSAFVVIRERWRAERDSLAARTIAAAETSFQLAQQALRRGEWQQALDSYSEAATLGYQDHFAIDIGEVQALNGIEPADARTRLARIDERALAPAQRAKLLLLRGGLTTDWTKNPDAGFATLLMARETRTLSKADDLYAQALLEPDLRKAWPLLQAALVDDPGHPDALRVALPVSVFAGTSRDMLALVHQYSGACPGDRRLPLMRAIALLLNEQPLDEPAIETELKRSDVAEVAGLLLPMLRLIADLRIAQARSSDALPPRDAFQKALPLVRAALANPSSGDWPFVLHPSLVRCAPHLKKFLGGAFLGMAIDKPLRDLEALVPDRFWEPRGTGQNRPVGVTSKPASCEPRTTVM